MMKIVVSVLVCVLMTAALCAGVFALDFVDTEATGDINLSFFVPESTAEDAKQIPAEGTAFYVYKVADIDKNCRLTPCVAFASAENIGELSKDEPDYEKLTASLSAFVKDESNALTATYTGNVGADGYLTFEDVPVGVYFVCGDAYQIKNRSFCPVSFMVSMPTRTGDTFVYNTDAQVKHYNAWDSIKVVLYWLDNNSHNLDNLTVTLLKNGAPYSKEGVENPKELNAANNWQCEWTNLEPGEGWNIKIAGLPDGYSFKMNSETGLFEIFCDIQEADPVLPQTGLLWWPVPVLLLCGVACVSLGIAARQKRKKES